MEINEIFGWVGSLMDMLGLRPFIIAIAIVGVALTLVGRVINR